MALVRFDQDPELQPGAGTFHADDGSTFFAHDPDMAAQLSPDLQAVAYPLKDERMASNAASADIDALNRELGGQQPAPQVASDVQGQSRTIPAAMAPPAPSSDMPQAPAEPQASPALGQADQLQANVDAYAMRPVYQAPTRGGVVPTTQSEVRETNGMPYDPNGPEAMQRADASINMNMAGAQKAGVESARAAGEAAAYQAALPQLEEQARIAQMRRDAQDRQYRRDRQDLEAAIEQSNTSAKSFNANRWFDDRGAIGGIGAAIAQAFGAGAAALTGGPNVVLQQLNAYQDRDIANQRAQIEADEKGANNALAQLNRQFGNLDQAEAALRLAQQNKVETMAKSYAASTKSEDVMNSLNMWLAENEQRRVAAEQQFQNAAYGKTSLTTAAKVITPTAGGMRAPTEKEVQQRYETLQKRGKVVEGTYEGEIKRQEAMGTSGKKKDKLQEEVSAYGKAIEGAKLNESTSSMANVEEKLREYAGSSEIPGIGPENVLTRANRAVDDYVVGPGEANKRIYSKEERANRQTIEFMKADIRHALTGAGMSDKERANLDDMIEGARTGDDFRNVVKIVKTRVAAHKSELARGFSPEAVRLYEERGVNKPMPQRTVK